MVGVWEDVYSVIEPQINAEGVHIWPFDPLLPVDVRRFAFRKQLRLNRHEYFEILIATAGVLHLQVQGRQLALGEGDLLLINSTVHHRACECEKQARGIVLCFLPDAIRVCENPHDATQYLMPFLIQEASFPPVVRADTELPAEVLSWVERVEALLPANSAVDRLTVKTYLKAILLLLADHFKSYGGTELVYHRRLKALKRLRPLFDLIDQRPDSRITTHDAARLLCVRPSHFRRFFKSVTGQSLSAQLTQFRIARAQSLLALTDKSLADIALDVGFRNESYFCTVFGKLAGTSPDEYRQQAKAGPKG